MSQYITKVSQISACTNLGIIVLVGRKIRRGITTVHHFKGFKAGILFRVIYKGVVNLSQHIHKGHLRIIMLAGRKRRRSNLRQKGKMKSFNAFWEMNFEERTVPL